MTFLAAVVFPVIAILCALAVMVSLTRFVAEIRRDARRDDEPSRRRRRQAGE